MIQRFIKKWRQNKLQVSKQGSESALSKSHKQRLAQAGESFARAYLEGLGWVVEELNWRSGRYAEIDIIARDKAKTLVFVEVKARRTNGKELGFMQAGFDSIDEHKRRKIVTAAFHYLAKHNLTEQRCRFDAVVLYYPKLEACTDTGAWAAPQLIHVEDIFQL